MDASYDVMYVFDYLSSGRCDLERGLFSCKYLQNPPTLSNDDGLLQPSKHKMGKKMLPIHFVFSQCESETCWLFT